MKKRKVNPRVIHFVLVGLILLGFVIFAFGNIIVDIDNKISGEPVRSLDGDVSKIVLDENKVELTGTIETIVVDDFENQRADYLYYLNENGKRTELEFEDSFPRVYRGEVSVSGTKEGDVLRVDSVEKTEKSIVSGYDYPIVGDQKYLVVYLRHGDQNAPENMFDKISSVSDEVNLYLLNGSYGKLNLSLDYWGDLIIPDTINFSNIIPYTYDSVYSDLESEGVNFDEYEGMVVYSPFRGCIAAGSQSTGSLRGGLFFMSPSSLEYSLDNSCFIHELGHTFRFGHSNLLLCGDFPDRVPLGELCWHWEYGSHYDPMGRNDDSQHYALPHKVQSGWVEQGDVPEVRKGEYLISSLSDQNPVDGSVRGLRVPIEWDIYSDVSINCSQEWPYECNEIFPMGDFFVVTHYFLEYRDLFEDEFYVGHYNTATKGILIRLFDGTFASEYFGLWSLSMNPNERNCYEYGGETICNELGDIFSYLAEGETYTDEFNNMNITVLDMNESGALINITRWEDPVCVPSCSGKECGDDGCGGSCGTCPTGSYCGLNAPSGICGYPENWPKEDCDNPKNKFNPACVREALK